MDRRKDSPMQPAGALERVAGSPVTGAAAGALGIWAGDCAALLPSLLDSLARGRQAERVERAVRELDDRLRALETRGMSDDQYKVVCEAVTGMFSTVEPEKFAILRDAAIGAVHLPAVVNAVSTPIGRLLRDLSVVEVQFLVAHIDSNYIGVVNVHSPDIKAGVDGDKLFLEPGSPDELAMSGLVSLGLLYVKSPTLDVSFYEWSLLAARIVRLLQGGAKK